MPGWGCFLSQDCLHVGSVDYKAVDAGYEAAVAAVHAEADSLEKAGVPPGRILIGGFSQGAAVALQSACSYPRRLAGCIALSGWLSQGAQAALSSSSLKDFPVLLCHGTKDDMVGFDCAEAATSLLREAGVSLQFERLEGVEHSSCAQELRAVAAFLQKVLAPGAGAPAWRLPQGEDSSDGEDGDEEGGAGDISYISKRSLDKLRGQLDSGAEISTDDIVALESIEDLADEEVLVPVKLGQLCVGFTDLQAMLRELGARGAAQAFVKAADALGKDMPEAERPPEITAKDWRELDSSDIDSAESPALLLEEGEEEAPKENDEIVDVEAIDAKRAAESDKNAEPAPKKPKTG